MGQDGLETLNISLLRVRAPLCDANNNTLKMSIYIWVDFCRWVSSVFSQKKLGNRVLSFSDYVYVLVARVCIASGNFLTVCKEYFSCQTFIRFTRITRFAIFTRITRSVKMLNSHSLLCLVFPSFHDRKRFLYHGHLTDTKMCPVDVRDTHTFTFMCL